MQPKSILKATMLALFVLLLAGTLTITAQEPAESPQAAATAFYDWYLANVGYDEATETMRNIMVDGTYRESPYLTAAFIAELDELLGSEMGIGHDVFICAQDIPAFYELETVSEGDDSATLLLETFFGWNPRPNPAALTLVAGESGWQIDGIDCMETVTPQGVVYWFYTDYIQYARPAQGEMRNPLVDGYYQESPLLSESLIAEVDALLADPQPGGGDPFLCAQDFPQWVWTEPVSARDDAATVLLRQTFQNNPDHHFIAVNLVRSDAQWMIDSVTCEAAPETVAELVYNQYASYMRHDFQYGIEPRPLDDWGLWYDHLSESLRADLDANGFVSGDGFGGGDRFLCAQDFPEYVTVERIEAGDGTATVAVGGMFAGQDAATPLVEATLIEQNGRWLLDEITCAAR